MEGEAVIVAHIDAAHWWGPAGWLYRQCMGNLAASAIWGPVGLIVGAAWERRKVIGPIHRKLDAHHEAQMDAHRTTHAAVTEP